MYVPKIQFGLITMHVMISDYVGTPTGGCQYVVSDPNHRRGDAHK
jgi:hypothetical protein